MLKGVNKQIIEVTDTGNNYIKKAILFVNPEKSHYDEEFLIHQAKKYLQQTEKKDRAPKPPSKKKKLLFTLGEIGAGAAAGAVLTLLLK